MKSIFIHKLPMSILMLTVVATAGIVIAKDSNLADKSVKALNISFVYHIDADMAEQDVFVEHQSDSTQVYRVTSADRNLQAQLYYPAKEVTHAPFDPSDIGPYPKGRPMGFTLGEWLAARGSGSYRCDNGKGELSLNFTGLRSDAVYTIWHFFFASPPTKPSIGTYDIPLGTRDGAQSVFRTDGMGNANIRKTIMPCLQMSGEQIASGLAVAWHSDGRTYGALPGQFSLNSHVHLFAMLPKRATR